MGPYQSHGVQLHLNAGVARIVLADSKNKNILSIDRLTALHRVWDQIEREKPSQIVILSESASIFAAGADIRELLALNPQSAEEYASLGQSLMMRIEVCEAQVFALVSGPCYGGALDLILACNHVWATERASFCHPGPKLGIMTGFGGTVRLPQKVGPRKARWMLISGSILSADEALTCGLISNKFANYQEMIETL